MNMSRRQEVLLSRPEGRAIFAPEGRLPAHGSRFCQPALSASVGTIQQEGARSFYEGEWADRLVEAVGALGGRMRVEDLAAYKPVWQPALVGSYLGFEIRTTHPPHNGGAHILAALGIAEALELHRQLPRRDSGRTLYQEIRAAAAAMSERAFDLDPADASPGDLAAYEYALTPSWASGRADVIRSADGPAQAAPPPLGSQNVIIRDDSGNVVVGIHTIHSDSWGDTGLIVGGVALNSSAHRLQLRRPRPGGRVTEPGSVFLTFCAGEAVLASGAHNKAGHEAELQNLIDVLGRGKSIEDSVNGARFGFFAGDHPLPWRPEYARGRAVEVEDFSATTLEEISALGQSWRRREGGPPIDVGFWYATDLRSGRRSAVADPRRLGLALAE
jgi:gamma-glutamyltranspeptidase